MSLDHLTIHKTTDAAPNASGLASRLPPPGAARVCRAAAFRRGPSAMPCRGQRSARRWRRNPLVTPSNAGKRARCRGHLPNEGHWSAGYIQQSRGGFDLAHRLGQRSPGDANLAPIRLARVSRPTRSRLARLPLDAFQNIARCPRGEFVCADADADFGANAIHCFGHVISCVARQVFFRCIAKKLAARTFGASSQPLHIFEDIVRDRYRCFHTKSMTRFSEKIKRSSVRSVFNKPAAKRTDGSFMNGLKKELKA